MDYDIVLQIEIPLEEEQTASSREERSKSYRYNYKNNDKGDLVWKQYDSMLLGIDIVSPPTHRQ